VTNKFNNGWSYFDLEFMEGDNPASMFALWWKEKCSTTASPWCAPELTCAGSTGVPIIDT